MLENKVICFPDDFTRLLDPELVKRSGVKLLLSFSLAALCRRAVQLGLNGPVQSFGFGMSEQPYVYLRTRGFQVAFATKPSPGSAARYLLCAELAKDFLLLLQLLPPNSQTSRHYHLPPGRESYHVLAGSGKLHIAKRVYALGAGRSQAVNAGQVHQYKTGEQPVITLLEISGIANCLGKENHYYVEG